MIIWQPENIVALEIWHGRVGDKFLYEFAGRERGRALIQYLVQLHRGAADTRDPVDTAALESARHFQEALILGGSASEVSGEFLESLPFEIKIDPNPYASWNGATKIASSKNLRNICAIDLGQTGAKVQWLDGKKYYPRDFDRLPVRSPSVPYGSEDSSQQSEIHEWVSRLLNRAQNQAGSPFDGVMLGLPSKILGTFCEGCSYIGLTGDLREIFANLYEESLFIANDAVLTATGIQSCCKSLVVTLGHGVGAAVCQK